jgi:hypothetical protein
MPYLQLQPSASNSMTYGHYKHHGPKYPSSFKVILAGKYGHIAIAHITKAEATRHSCMLGIHLLLVSTCSEVRPHATPFIPWWWRSMALRSWRWIIMALRSRRWSSMALRSCRWSGIAMGSMAMRSRRWSSIWHPSHSLQNIEKL